MAGSEIRRSDSRENRARVFLAVGLPAALQASLAGRVRQWRQSLTEGRVSWVAGENLHVTLKFFGEVDVKEFAELGQAIRERAIEFPAFPAVLGGMGVFPKPQRPRVVWVGLGSEASGVLVSLHGALDEATQFWGEREAQTYHPHVTVARIKEAGPLLVPQLSALLDRERQGGFGDWRVAEIQLMRSDLTAWGARYTVVERFALAGKTG